MSLINTAKDNGYLLEKQYIYLNLNNFFVFAEIIIF